MSTLLQLVNQARVEHPCSQGHAWKFIGARQCNEDENGTVGCRGSRPVYECTRCGDSDYGDEIGRADCERDCSLATSTTRNQK